MVNSKCKICRRQGIKLFLRGERCFGPKCAMIKRAYPPGPTRKRRKRGLSEYGRELREKQRLKNWYNLRERPFKKYVKEVLEKRGKVQDIADLFIKKLELRFDNVIFRLGFASSRSQARQLVSHGHFFINGKKVDIPSRQLKKEDKITIRASSLKKEFFKKIIPVLKKYQPPSWLKFDPERIEAEVIGQPTLKEAQPPAEISLIFEFYSK